MSPSQNEELREGVPRYVAQAIPQFDAETVEKAHLWMETGYLRLLGKYKWRKDAGVPMITRH
jgi:hypothetical protein